MFKLFAIVVVCCIQAAFCASIPCPCGWKKIRSGCYLFVKNRVSWDHAFAGCRKLGAQLAIPTNWAENRDLGATAKIQGLYFPWIGVFRRYDKRLVTLGGSHPSFTDWNAKQPDNYANNENCVQIIAEDNHNRNGHYTLGKWNDQQCQKKYDYMCEIKSPMFG